MRQSTRLRAAVFGGDMAMCWAVLLGERQQCGGRQGGVGREEGAVQWMTRGSWATVFGDKVVVNKLCCWGQGGGATGGVLGRGMH
jgi:hypothetical protein